MATTPRKPLSAIILPTLTGILTIFADWRTVKAIREEIDELISETEAIQAVAQEENRELTDEESKRIDEVLGTDDKPGLVDKLSDDAKRKEKVDNKRRELMGRGGGNPAPGQGDQLPPQTGDGELENNRTGSIIAAVRVPSAAERVTLRACKAYKSAEENYRAAYALGMYALSKLSNNETMKAKASEWCKTNGVSAGLNTGTPASGGYLIPTELSAAIIYIRDMFGVFRGEAEYEPMMSDTKDCVKQLTGAAYTFTGEGVAHTENNPTYGNVQLVAQKVSCLVRFSDELDEDSIIAMGDRLAMDIGEALAQAEDDCGFTATGSGNDDGEPGLTQAVGAAGLVDSGVDANTLDDLDNAFFRGLIAKIPGKYRRGCKWYANSTVVDAAIQPLLDAAGGNTQNEIATGGSRTMFKGYPVVEVQALPDVSSLVADSRFLIFGNIRAAAKFGDRRGIIIKRSDQVYWTTDEIGVKGSERFQSKVHEPGDADDVGAYVVVKL